MKKVIVAALAVLGLMSATVQAQSYSHAAPHSGAYDNTGRGPQQTGLQGGGG